MLLVALQRHEPILWQLQEHTQTKPLGRHRLGQPVCLANRSTGWTLTVFAPTDGYEDRVDRGQGPKVGCRAGQVQRSDGQDEGRSREGLFFSLFSFFFFVRRIYPSSLSGRQGAIQKRAIGVLKQKRMYEGQLQQLQQQVRAIHPGF